ncbi:MAG: methionine--tRNA ligase [Planctomycetota bacterium]
MTDTPTGPCYLTTPIYYVNDAPHIGHCYTTLVADVLARGLRLSRGVGRAESADHIPIAGDAVFLLTGTDEHADKVVTSAEQHDKTPLEWADINADRFRAAFDEMGFSHDDFIRTTQERHTSRVPVYLRTLLDSGDVYLGDYTGWYDDGQEEYVPENEAREADYVSKISGKPLTKRTEQNYFFRLSAYQDTLREAIETSRFRVEPEARRNEVLGRIRDGLQDVPISRAVEDPEADVWGIRMPGDPGHRVYVWIDALFNYVTAVDTDERRSLWPATVHLVGKDILWFHAVIWPCMLMALGKAEPERNWDLPGCLYAHGWWVSEGKKMSKSMGNFIDLPTLRGYADRFGLDGVRWYLATQGPLGANDADFAYAKFVEVYNSELANGIGNSTSRVGNMIDKYQGGELTRECNGEFGLPGGKALGIALAARRAAGKPADDESRTFNFAESAEKAVAEAERALAEVKPDDVLRLGVSLVREVDDFISYTAPFTLAKQLKDHEHGELALATILYSCAEALRIASLFMSPAMPSKMAELWRAWGCVHLRDALDPLSGFSAPLAELARWNGSYGFKRGHTIRKGEALFMRADAAEDAPEPIDNT